MTDRMLSRQETRGGDYRRTGLRVVLGAMLLGFVALLVKVAFIDEESGLTRGEVTVVAAGSTVLALGYLYVSSSVRWDTTHLSIRNPFHRVDLLLGDVVAVESGMTMVVSTADKRYPVWAVEGSLAQAVDDFEDQEGLAARILSAARDAPRSSATPRWCFSRPDLLFSVAVFVNLLCSAALWVQVG